MRPGVPINLAPSSHRQQRTLRRAVRGWTCGVFAYAAVALLAFITYATTGAREYRALGTELSSVEQRARSTNISLNELRRRQTDVAQRQVVGEVVRNRPDWSVLLYLLAKSCGKEIDIDVASLAPVETVAGAGADPRPKDVQVLGRDEYTLTLKGRGVSQQAVSQFALRLQRLAVFSSVELTKSVRDPTGKPGQIQFEIRCPIGGEVAK